MFIYVFDQDKFLETESLFLHDIALLIDNKQKLIYLWYGKFATDEDFATKIAEETVKKYKSYELIVLGDEIPLKVQAEIDILLGDNADPEKHKIARTIAMRFSVIFGKLGLLATLIFVINNMLMLGWDSVDNNFKVDQWTFNDLFEISAIIGIVMCALFLAQFISAAVTKHLFIIVCAGASLVMALGTLLYIAEGEFIFEFLTGSEYSYIYLIRRLDVIVHIIWMIGMMIAIAIPLVLVNKIVNKQTEVKEKEIVDLTNVAKRPSILRDKFSSIKEVK
jgi:hypothetical protein